MTEQEAYNSLENHITSIGKKATKSLNSYGDTNSKSSLEIFNKRSEVIYRNALARAAQQSKKYSNKRITRQMIIDDAILDISGLSTEVSSSFAKNLMNFIQNLAKAIWKSITLMVDKLKDFFSDPIGALANFAAGLFNTLVANLRAIGAKIIGDFMKALKAMIASIVGRIQAILNMGIDAINKAIDTYNKIIQGYNDVKDFYKRAKKLSTTAQEIQINKPDINGKIKKNAEALKGTVQDKIMTPQMKSDVQAVKDFTEDPIAKILGFLGSLVPKINLHSIKEPKPTAEKAVYGKIVANVNKAGFTEISDSTPGNVRKIALHPSGTYNGMLNDGSVIAKTTGDKTEITDKNWNITTTKDKVEIIAGDSKIEIRKNHFENLKADKNTNVDGVVNTVVAGNVNDDFKGDYSGKTNGNYVETVAGNKTEKTSENLTETVAGNHKETVTGSFTIHVTGNVNIISGGNASLTALGQVAINGSKIMLG